MVHECREFDSLTSAAASPDVSVPLNVGSLGNGSSRKGSLGVVTSSPEVQSSNISESSDFASSSDADS